MKNEDGNKGNDLLSLIQGKRDEKFAQLRKAQEDMPVMIEYLNVLARLHWEKFNALKQQGFNDKQALELCKSLD